MIKYLLPHNAEYYKANLHSHTTLSDGNKTPEEAKRDYMSHGYSILAYTDHDSYYLHNDLTDENFVALNGFELEYNKVPGQQTCHVCFVALDPDNEALGYSEKDTQTSAECPVESFANEGGSLYRMPLCERKYTPEYINADIQKAKDLGFFVTYNHPTWSLEHYEDYIKYCGMDAMEMVNFNCIAEGYNDDNGRVYEDFLTKGEQMFCIGTDDNHNTYPDDDPYSDSYGGYIMIAAEKLGYKEVTKALSEGNFYACGKVNPAQGDCPQIKNLWLEVNEDGKAVHIETMGASSITLIKDQRPFGVKIAKQGEEIKEADFNLGNCKWFRLTITSPNGCKAYTNAYFLNRSDEFC